MFEHNEVTIRGDGEIGRKGNVLPPFWVRQMKMRIMAEEDARIFEILDSIASSGNKDI